MKGRRRLCPQCGEEWDDDGDRTCPFCGYFWTIIVPAMPVPLGLTQMQT